MFLDARAPLVITTIFYTLFVGSVNGNATKRMLVEGETYEILSWKVDNLTKEVAGLKNDSAVLKHQPVTFVAYLTKSIPGKNHHIIFDDVKLNIGNCYNAAHGNCVVPVTGMYQFTVTACSIANHGIVLELTVNTTVVDKVLAGDDKFNDCNTGVFFHRLNAGDDVYVQHINVGDYLLSHEPYGRTMFTGLLLYTL